MAKKKEPNKAIEQEIERQERRIKRLEDQLEVEKIKLKGLKDASA